MRAPLSFALLAVLGFASCDRPSAHPPDTGAKNDVPRDTAEPRLVVLIVIDQLPSWSFDAQRTELTGGIARLLREGTYWPRAAFPYAATLTGPGHATIGSGTTPSVHGIIANRWVDREAARLVEVDADLGHPAFGKDGRSLGYGHSSVRLRAPGIADALHAARPRGRAVAIGWKSRAAILVLGQHPDLAVWFDTNEGVMTTSSAYASERPAWVGALADRTSLARISSAWTPIDAAQVARLAGREDAAPDEGDPYGLGNTFPHDISRTSAPYKALAFMPEANAVLVDTAIAALDGESLGADLVPDILAITFSPHDFAAHVWCQESWERVDHLLRIDRDLGRLFDELDTRLGKDGWSAVLTSDHGSLPSRARLASEGKAPGLVHIGQLAALAETAATEVLGKGTWTVGATTVGLTMSAAFHQQPAPLRERVLDAIVAALEKTAVHWVSRTDRTRAHCDGDDIAALACRSIHAEHSGEIYFVGKEWGLLNDEHHECTAHGSPWSYDREVPIIVRAPGWTAGERSDSPSMLSIAPTLAAILGIAPPAAARADPLPRAP